ncbi:hypothetical protein IFM89_023114 [Coptis chinensis]|uniref:Uncharacterized protein n=1 Tax=Coptis chinensis TaxID=261450 RepID=A0A835HUR4_9MAGN|nr:hypothetical protein IFM89_023114 [Coptis chinensis]
MEEEKDYFDNIEEEKYLVVKQNRVVVVEEAQIPVKEIVKKIEEENLVLGEADGGEEVTNEDCVLEKSKGKEERPMKEGVLYFGVNDDIPTREERTVEEVVKGVEENGYKENNGVLDEKMVTIEVQGMVEGRRDDEKLDDMVEEMKPIVETKQMVEERRIGKANDVPIEVEKPVMKKKRMKKKRVRITINKDNSREIADESGLDLYDKETPSLQQYNYEGVEICENRVAPAIGAGIEPQEVSSKPSSLCVTEERPSDVLGEESADSVLHPVPSERSEIKPAVSEVNTTIPSKEVIYSEEKIWEMIFAMRKIVGYKADIQPNVAEELKALYIFTGVEAPMGFKDPLDLSEVDDKLRLLMAIIGVK